jgi:EAL domain-containing protein (putative c-di-GMP-specific phosphodiesterase class I)
MVSGRIARYVADRTQLVPLSPLDALRLDEWNQMIDVVIPTDELLRIVEPTGVMQQLTRHVLDRVVAQLADWNRVGLHLRAALNVSVLDLITDDFDAHIREVLRRHGISPRQLDIEITEGATVDDTVLLDEAAMRLARVGVGLTLDDFGTGFASLRRLRRLPLAEVKIDRS